MPFMILTLVMVGAVRLLVPLTILQWPLLGFLLSMLADAMDWGFIPHSTEAELAFYNRWDKFFDLYFVSLALSTVFSWQDRLAKRIAVGLYLWRLLGVILFEFTGQRWLLFLFPNVFDFYFIFIVGYKKLVQREKVFKTVASAGILVFLLLSVKLTQEYFIHVIKALPWQFIAIPLLGEEGQPESELNRLVWLFLFYVLMAAILLAKIYLDRDQRRIAENLDETKDQYQQEAKKAVKKANGVTKKL